MATIFTKEIQGKEYGFHIGLAFMGGVIRSGLADDIQDLGVKMSGNVFDYGLELMTFSHHTYIDKKLKGEGKKLTKDELLELLDDSGIGTSFMLEFVEKLTSTMHKDVPNEPVNPAAREKNSKKK